MEGRSWGALAELCGEPKAWITSVCQAVTGYIHIVRQTFSVDDLTVLVSQSSKPGELHGYCRAPSQPAGLGFYWEKQGVGGKEGDMHPYLVPVYMFTQYLGTGAE